MMSFLRRPTSVRLALALVLAAPAPMVMAGVQDAAPAFPERVIVNLTAEPATSLAFTWRTPRDAAGQGFIEYAPLGPGPDFARHAVRLPAQREAADFVTRDDGPVSADYYSVVLSGLTPSAEYAYRVGREGAWSPWRRTRTAEATNAPFVFLYLGDVQNDIRSMGGLAVRRALSETPDAAFVLYTGDLINRADNDVEWGEWFGMAVDAHASLPSLMTPGNHEYSRPAEGAEQQLAPQWRRQFTLPANGPAPNVMETAYRVDHQGVRLIALDADMFDESPSAAQAQLAWLERELAGAGDRWKVVFLHYPLYSTARGRDSEDLRAALQPILDRHHVALVLAGHDHTYGRGRPHAQGPVYMVSNVGPKQYVLGDIDWAERRGSGIQVYQRVEVTPQSLTVRAYTQDGELYDAFRLDRDGRGPAALTDMRPDRPELLLKTEN